MKFSRILLLIIIFQTTKLISWELPKFSMPSTPSFVTKAVEDTAPYITKKNVLIAGIVATSSFLLYHMLKPNSLKNAGKRKGNPNNKSKKGYYFRSVVKDSSTSHKLREETVEQRDTRRALVVAATLLDLHRRKASKK
ncbi:MAG: hypothetical protein P4L22_05375 [Candidatus Babeliales bacterium]|nr:hypothetical protein [Candidatus Babeliales bacterium]